MINKTVFDVNIWLRYFISGKAEKIIDMIEDNDVFFYRSAELTSELKDIINRPKFSKYFPTGTNEYILLNHLKNFLKNFLKKSFDLKKNRIFAPAERVKTAYFYILQADF